MTKEQTSIHFCSRVTVEKPLKYRNKGAKRLSVLLFLIPALLLTHVLIVFDIYVVLVLVCMIVAQQPNG